MGFFQWYEGLVRKVSEKNLSLAIMGEMLAVLILGSYFSIDLVRYGLYILIGAVIVLVNYVNTAFF